MSLKYFELEEFNCSHCGENHMDFGFLERLDTLRDKCGFAFVITSGYRCPEHPSEAAKERPGTHTQGIAADIKVDSGVQRHRIVDEALKMGFRGVGVANSFVHVDDRRTYPVMWTY